MKLKREKILSEYKVKKKEKESRQRQDPVEIKSSILSGIMLSTVITAIISS